MLGAVLDLHPKKSPWGALLAYIKHTYPCEPAENRSMRLTYSIKTKILFHFSALSLSFTSKVYICLKPDCLEVNNIHFNLAALHAPYKCDATTESAARAVLITSTYLFLFEVKRKRSRESTKREKQKKTCKGTSWIFKQSLLQSSVCVSRLTVRGSWTLWRKLHTENQLIFMLWSPTGLSSLVSGFFLCSSPPSL